MAAAHILGEALLELRDPRSLRELPALHDFEDGPFLFLAEERLCDRDAGHGPGTSAAAIRVSGRVPKGELAARLPRDDFNQGRTRKMST